MRVYASAASADDIAIGPDLIIVEGVTLSNGMRPNVTASPYTPDIADGIRIEPPPSKPTATGQIPSATATADPDELPPE
eukprot:CAMPEP_0204877904 /NCGR_PEP_ID=MMETSP1348-20121228/48451_1 /ASSEMBLY_ACC=CAM_ASM_000700 /TAXON_ID=215587 /ORGANISM="Aplanochytrium stocchinoi, Strain GSBS06" /LENGTH=78 /DNA_ID=CAMNT_0052034823 /DNA_START=882 /DNA_END=1118 /DNA_ORIENTATION=+